VRAFAATAHAPLRESEEPGWGCDACHGPGWDHSDSKLPEDIERPETLAAAETAELCSRCHFETLRVLDAAGRHAGADRAACTDCHAIHGPPEQAAGENLDTVAGCAGCHPDAVAVHQASLHRHWFAWGGTIACMSCHGEEVQAHAEDPEAVHLERPRGAELEAHCVTCHEERGPRWQGTIHEAGGLACLDCHEPFDDTGSRAAEHCLDCHPASRAEFQLPYHHPLEEGAVACSDCHDPHDDGGRGVFAGRRLARRCEECHSRETGPFVFSHEAGRLDGCGACHEAHGSPNPKLLRMWPLRDLCLSCHPATPANHDQRSFSPFRECITCHVEIHGSDLDRRYFR